jgi:hypothetical protein
MLKPRNIVAGLLVLLALIGDSFAQSRRSAAPNRQQEQPTTQQQTTAPDKRGTEQEPFVVQPLTTKKSAEETERDAREAKEKTNSDWWTWLLNVLTVLALFGQFAILAAQAYFLRGTLKVTAASAKAAEDAAVVAREALNTTQRAFVRVVNFPWLWRPDIDRPGKYFYDITPIIENGGNTPTVDMTIVINSALRDSILPDDFNFPYGVEPGPSLIGAHQTIGAHRAIILDDNLLLVQKGEKFFYIWGTITYRDVFEGTPLHTTEFCTEISTVFGNPLDPKDPGAPKGTTVEIGFRIYPKHQRTD